MTIRKHRGFLRNVSLALLLAVLLMLNPFGSQLSAQAQGSVEVVDPAQAIKEGTQVKIPLTIQPITAFERGTIQAVLYFVKLDGTIEERTKTFEFVYADVYMTPYVYNVVYTLPVGFGEYGVALQSGKATAVGTAVYLAAYIKETPAEPSEPPVTPVIPGPAPVTGTETGWQSYDFENDRANCYVVPDKVQAAYEAAPESGAVIMRLLPVPGTTVFPSKAVANIPLAVLEMGGFAPVPSVLELGSCDLLVSPQVMSALAARVTADAGPLGTLQIRVHASMDQEAMDLLGSMPEEDLQRMTLASDVISVSFVAVDPAGKESSIRVDEAALFLRFDPDKVGNPEHVNLYKLGSVIFVSGKVVGDKVVATIPEFVSGRFIALEHSRAFDDVVEGYWGKKDIELMASKYVIKGMTKTSFEPETPITRAEFVTMVVRSLGLGEQKPEKPTFSDVRVSDWHYGYVEAAYKAGLAKGDEGKGGRFRPDDTISREEMAALMIRAMQVFGKAARELSQEEVARILESFDDGADISQWARHEAAQAVSQELIKGRGAGTFAPRATGKRAEAATLMSRWMKHVGIL